MWCDSGVGVVCKVMGGLWCGSEEDGWCVVIVRWVVCCDSEEGGCCDSEEGGAYPYLSPNTHTHTHAHTHTSCRLSEQLARQLNIYGAF